MTYEVLNRYNHQDVIYKWINNRGDNTFYSMLQRGQSTLSEYIVQKEDESYVYVDITSCNSDIDLIL